jgi:hypothetical protein
VINVSAHTPEELETLLEDTLVLQDAKALAALFEVGAIFVLEHQAPAYADEAIVRLALARWNGENTYIAEPQCIVQAHDIALIINASGINVAHRGSDRYWRYRIAFVYFQAKGVSS